MKPIKQLEQIEAKLKLLAYLQQQHNVTREIVEAAKAKLGADLSDALSGELGEDLRKRFDADVSRLEKGDLQPGDWASYQFGHETKVHRVKRVEPNSITVETGSGSIGDYGMNRHEARPDPKKLDELRQLRDACFAAAGKGTGKIDQDTMSSLAAAFRGAPEQYPTIDLPED